MDNKLKVVFVSNFMNHHQLPIALEMYERYEYAFIATEPIAQEQLNMKYEDMNKKYDFILRSYEDGQYEKALDIINDANVVIFGSCPFEMVQGRIEQNKLTFRYSERIFKEKTLIRKFHPVMWKRYYAQCTKYKNKSYFLLCASAYAAKDYVWFGAFKNKAFKWGYFPQVEVVDVDEIMLRKANNKELKIIWCNRLVKYKHPEMAVLAGKFLRDNGYAFNMEIVGVGPLKDKVQKLIDKYGLSQDIKMVGSVPTEEVREKLKGADIALLTADKGEGWGAVVNESMNSCCAVLCNQYTGSVPYLVTDGQSGLIYKNKKEFLSKLKLLADDAQLRRELGSKAYHALAENWNAKKAVNNFDALVKNIINNEQNNITEGPCSKA